MKLLIMKNQTPLQALTTTELTFDFDGQRNSLCCQSSNDETPAKTFIDVGIQVKSGDLITDFCDVIKTYKELNTLTGIVSFDILNTILDVFMVGFPKYESEKNASQ
ncbi:hypothetical protein KQX54_000527 [Cotesia glomerata]|uniref:Uncharacterized protein n=1 Tax=Cotesia glomerata TaxID=32391 RepID=A0AAV7IGZ6_COTGL|nr:hypothetical protein KQX54_000527 [Cotesia glomerata]